jgi:hypothetical protein
MPEATAEASPVVGKVAGRAGCAVCVDAAADDADMVRVMRIRHLQHAAEVASLIDLLLPTVFERQARRTTVVSEPRIYGGQFHVIGPDVVVGRADTDEGPVPPGQFFIDDRTNSDIGRSRDAVRYIRSRKDRCIRNDRPIVRPKRRRVTIGKDFVEKSRVLAMGEPHPPVAVYLREASRGLENCQRRARLHACEWRRDRTCA